MAWIWIKYKKVVGVEETMLKPMIITCMVLLIALSPVEGARTYIVDDDGFANYKTIGEAVTAASDGDTILIKPGTYPEEVILDKKLSIKPLTGEEGPCILEGKETAIGIKVEAEGCSIEGLTMANFTGGPAVYLSSNGNSIKKCKFVNNLLGIFLNNSDLNLIENNVEERCYVGVGVQMNSDRNVIRGNSALGCNRSIVLNQVKENNLTDNTADDSVYGIYLSRSDKNQISKNVMRNTLLGILLESSQDNSIRECTFENTTGSLVVAGSSKNSILANSISSTRDTAIAVNDSGENIISDNKIANSENGIVVVYSTANSILANSISSTRDTAITVSNSMENTISDNKIANSETGIMIGYSTANKLHGNDLTNVDFGLYVEGPASEHFDQLIDETNLIDGKPILYNYAQKDLFVKGRELAHVTLAHCSNCTLEGNRITNDAIFLYNTTTSRILDNIIENCWGIRLQSSYENELRANQALNNSFSGIFMVFSDSNLVRGNNLSQNRQNGLTLLDSDLNNISDNVMDANGYCGLFSDFSQQNNIYENTISNNAVGVSMNNSFMNEIFHNNFLNNVEQAEDLQGNNTWDLGAVGGNFWSDHKCVGSPCAGFPRLIKGSRADNNPYGQQNGWMGPKAT